MAAVKTLLLMALVLGLSTPAAALTVDQVIALRKAGISNQTIQIMIDNENKVRKQGGVGSYVVKHSGGSETIVYEARGQSGVEEYPISQVAPGQGPVLYNSVLSPRAGKVAIDAPLKKTAVRKSSRKNSSSGGYALHLSSFQKQENASRQVRSLKGKGVSARMVTADIPGKGRWYRVLVGDFKDQAQAQAQGESLKASGKIASFRILKK